MNAAGLTRTCRTYHSARILRMPLNPTTTNYTAVTNDTKRYHHAWPRSPSFLCHSHLSREPGLNEHLNLWRNASSSASSTRWKTRQTNDAYAREAKVAGLKSRAAFKLLEIDSRFKIFRRGDTVVDLGFAPGSWSQVAVSKTQPGGRVIGIDVIPAQPPRGANALQGNFLSADVRERLREFVSDRDRGRVQAKTQVVQGQIDDDATAVLSEDAMDKPMVAEHVPDTPGETKVAGAIESDEEESASGQFESKVDYAKLGLVVDVVLSDMSAPWPLVNSVWVKSVNTPYLRMMNTSGMAFRDHAGSMDLCLAALDFCYSTLAIGGNFLTKYYMGAEDQIFEKRLRRLFHKVHRIKPDSSRKESKEAYFLALRRRSKVERETVFGDLR